MDFSYGTVLKIQREHSLDDIRQLLDNIRRAGLNTIVIWPAVYWWEDRSKAGYPYNTGRFILEYAGQVGLKIIMETAGQQTNLEYAPDFIMKQEYLPIKFNGEIEYRDSGYGFLNYFHPEVAGLIEKQLIEVTTAYKGYPALYGYDIFNETMFASFDRYTLEQFRKWLKNKYKTIEKLNDVWDHVYFDWSQIEFTPWTWLSVMPNVDYKQFHKASMGILLNGWRKTVKAIDPDHPVIADNLFSMVTKDNTGYRAQDEWNVAENIDELGLSYYPKANVPGLSPHRRWEILTGFNSASTTGRFWVSELQTHFQSFFNNKNVVSPAELRMWTWEAIAAGAMGLIYWMWHPFIKGIQTSGRGLVDYKGRFNERTYCVAEISSVLNKEMALFGDCSPEKSKAAILYDTLSHDFYTSYAESYPVAAQNLYNDSLEGLYKVLWENDVPATFVRPAQVLAGEISPYRVLFVSNQIAISSELAAALLRFAEQGGTIIIDGKSGYINEHGLLSGTIPGCDLNPSIGCDLVDIDPSCPPITMKAGSDKILTLPSYYERQIVEVYPDDLAVDILGTFPDGTPGVLARACGQGRIMLIPTYLWFGYLNNGSKGIAEFIQWLVADSKLRTYEVTGSLKVRVTSNDNASIIYAFNYAPQPVSGMITVDCPEGDYSIVNLADQKPDAPTIQVRTTGGKLIIKADVAAGDLAIYKIAGV